MELTYGKRITTESFFDKALTSKKISYSIPIKAQDKAKVLTEIMHAIDLIINETTNELTIIVRPDGATGKNFHIIKTYTLKE